MNRAAAIALFVWVAASSAAAQTSPSVLYRYGSGIDARCNGPADSQTVSQDQADALRARMPALQRAWDRQGPALLDAASSITGKRFAERGVVASFVFCRRFGSLAVPLLVDANLAVGFGFGAQPSFIITDIVFHELLHSLLLDHYPLFIGGPLARKYANEKPRVRGHLHLFALQSVVYRALGRDDVLADVIATSSRFGDTNRRAWQIVVAEGAEAFVAELRQVNQAGLRRSPSAPPPPRIRFGP
ncbi:MAG: hypothetical protein O7C63_05660 [Alphaproteobacteria bacterium]|nr:hypothetical protein [Alphaproteobacteria bacterium]